MASEKERVALLSLFASAGLAAAKLFAGLFTGSLGILSEAIHSLIDFGATVITYSAVRVADRPPDEKHHFGHAKAESVAALVETGLLFITCGWIVWEAVKRLWTGDTHVEVTWWAIAIIAGSIIVDFNRSHALSHAAQKHESEALEADALHFSSDMWSSIAVLIGLGLAWYGIPAADSVAALVVAAVIMWVAWDLGRRTLNTLLDAAPPGAEDAVRTAAEEIHGVLSLTRLRVRPAGPTQFVDAELNVRRTLPQNEVADIKDSFIRAVRQRLPKADVSVTTTPVALDDETVFDKVALLARRSNLQVHHLTVQHIGERLSVSLDLEVDGRLPLNEAHEIATQLERDIRGELGSDVEVESHIEPAEVSVIAGEPATGEVHLQVGNLLHRLAKSMKTLVTDVHNVRVRTNGSGLYVTFHCRVDGDTSVEHVHEEVDRLEKALRAKMPDIKRVIAHAEPIGRAPH
ncbi:MAG: cation-efflux pump [Hyphomicrobiales bacterium]